MISVEHSIFINRPAQVVFDIMAYPEGRMRWSAAQSEWATDAPHGVGSKTRGSAKFLGRNMEISNTVTAWEPPNLLTIKADGAIGAEMVHTFETRDGGTQLIITGNVDLSNLFKIAEPLLKRQIDKTMEADLGAIKLILESEDE